MYLTYYELRIHLPRKGNFLMNLCREEGDRGGIEEVTQQLNQTGGLETQISILFPHTMKILYNITDWW